MHLTSANRINSCNQRNFSIKIPRFINEIPYWYHWSHSDWISRFDLQNTLVHCEQFHIIIINFDFFSIWNARFEPFEGTARGWVYHFDGFIHRVRLNGVDFCTEAQLWDWFQSGASGPGSIKCIWCIFLMSAIIRLTFAFGHSRINGWTNTNRFNHFMQSFDIRSSLDWTILWALAQGINHRVPH